MDFFPVSDPLRAEARCVALAMRQVGQWLLHREDRGWAFPAAPADGDPDGAARALLCDLTDEAAEPQAVTAYRLEGAAGILYFAELPETAQIALSLCSFPVLPAQLARPESEPLLFQRVQWHLNLSSDPDELWDVYDEHRRRTGRLQRRGDPVAPGDFHLVVHCWLQDPEGRWLLTRRAPTKGYPLLWECTGGSALAGEDSLTAAAREVREETGLAARAECAVLGHTIQRDNHFLDLWRIRQDWDLNELRLQPGETVDAKWVRFSELLTMRQSGELVPYDYWDELLALGFFETGDPRI